jgi:hypothetical protein
MMGLLNLALLALHETAYDDTPGNRIPYVKENTSG